VELLPEEELRPEDTLLDDEPPEVLPLPPEELLLFDAVDLVPPEEDPLREAVALPEVVLLSLAEDPREVELPELLPVDDEDLDVVLLLEPPPLLVDAADLDPPLLEVVPLLLDSLLALLSLGVPPVERFVPVLLFEVVERPPDADVRLPEPEVVERPLELVERLPDAVERPPVDDVERPVDEVERPVDAVERPLDAVERPLDAVERPPELVGREPELEERLLPEPVERLPEEPVEPEEPERPLVELL
jgi:hypothetical protein